MSGPDDPFSFDAEFGDPDYVKAARDPSRPPETGPEWEPNGRAADAPIVNGGGRSPFADLNDGAETTAPRGDPKPPDPSAPMVEHALYYARRGWPVFPCKPTNKSPFFAGGFHVATTDEKTIRGWWGYWPKAMIGVPMGPRSGVWAVDPDPPKEPGEPDGRRIWDDFLIEHEHGGRVATHTELTPRGGYHIVFKWDPNRPVTNSPGALAKTNIDVRGEGGYIIVAPSVCVGDGTPKNVAGQYCVSENFFNFAIAPGWLYDLVLKKPEPKPTPKTAQAESPPRSSMAPDDGKQFWRKVNDIACQNLGAWVPDIFGSAAVYQPNTGAWRIKSEALGRENDEDLSIHPSGVTDWGVWDIGDPRGGRRSAIDIVIEFGRKRDAAEAALWLCERCGVDPQTLGWNNGGGQFDGTIFGFNTARPQDYGSKAGTASAGPDTSGNAGAAGGATQAPPKLKWLDMANWDSEPVPERKWAIRDRVPLNQVGLFSGEGGTGKSIVELMKNVAHVAARDRLGSLPEPGPAFYLGAEDDEDEIHIRLAAIAKHYGVTFEELIKGGLHILPLLGQDAVLCASTRGGHIETTALYRQIYEAAGDLKPKNISVDTLSRAFAGDEINRVQVYAFAMYMQALAKVASGSVTVLSHPSLSGMASGSGISGSTAWHGAFRFRQYLKGVNENDRDDDGKPPDTDFRELEFKKNQYGPLGQTISLRYVNGLFLPVGGVSSLEKLAREARADGVFMDLLRRFAGQGQNVSHKKNSPNYAPAAFAEEPEARGQKFRKSEFVEAMRRLFAADKIMVETYGRPSQLSSRLVVKPLTARKGEAQ